jgi:hypothetical protein
MVSFMVSLVKRFGGKGTHASFALSASGTTRHKPVWYAHEIFNRSAFWYNMPQASALMKYSIAVPSGTTCR